MLSGFVIYMSLGKKENPLDFAAGRFARVYPTYFACVLMTSIILSAFDLPNKRIHMTQVLMNLLILPCMFGTQKIDGAYWALYVELSFYLVMFVIFTCKALGKIKQIGICWLSVQFLCQILENIGIVRVPGKSYLLLSHGHLFIAGIALFLIWRNKRDAYAHAIVWLCVIAQVLQGDLGKTAAMLTFVMIFYFFLNGILGFFKYHSLRLIGDISYALYLLHQNIGYVIIYKMEGHGISPCPSIVAAIVISIILALMCTYFIEKPASNFIVVAYQRRIFLGNLRKL